MLPFPNDFYTVPDSTQPTGRRVYIPPGAFPPPAGSGAAGTFNPEPWEENDGFSPGSTLLTHVPNLSIAKTGMATESDIGASLEPDSPVVLLDTTTGARWPTWAEMDEDDHNPATQLLIIHPARDLTEGDHYIVALRNLKIASGATLQPSAAFAHVLVHDLPASGLSPAYTAHLRSIVSVLDQDGVTPATLFLAWDFTVASTRNITTPALTMRNQTFAALGKGVSPYLVSKVVDDPSGEPDLARVVYGYFDVPSYLSGPGGTPGSLLTIGANGQPYHVAGRVEVANFECAIPRSATARHRASIGYYGHGLFGSATEVATSAIAGFSNRYDYVFCSTDWLGLSSNTLALALAVVQNISSFPSLADNLMQSLLDAQVLGNLLVNPAGFAANPAFEDAGHTPLIRTGSGLVYYGNSEGGIMGGAFTAVSTEVRRAVLGVPGMDYALLLPRSTDFSPFLSYFEKSYPDEAVIQVAYDLIQMLWDRAEADGYAEQMTGGLPGTPRHQVLLVEAFGDHQVTNIATETEARTIGAAVHEPALAPHRSNERQPFWGLRALSTPSRGPALFVWDTGVPPDPLADVPPTRGADPHGSPRTFPEVWAQMHTFFSTGVVTNPCGSSPCTGPYP
ncbi:MAG TPA: hypothetical protein VL961_12155 [Acidimicrobiales bacterium]|nr:hypothetical protein [Acidimicrobiales bacterium]